MDPGKEVEVGDLCEGVLKKKQNCLLPAESD